ncbi:methyl-accepting chemotaxis protein [Permianibacter aggregans]|uniref:Methyl-accepting chemotaxis protein n=1 Tax=Permianibacter aggregans TaxID=1510150 RepID=A0A4V3D7J6_9GAMM|nr:methyl-accepting chemotaxis protein [Permianibacter aggregans]QGX41103.1 methyl-accepting chemotaxis protein [Permianibacter aggregans]TDQ48167.1 methyl-accepting chemotaxis protein [Permianibacter aggregans]
MATAKSSIGRKFLFLIGGGVGALAVVAIVGASILGSYIHDLSLAATLQKESALLTNHFSTAIQEWKNVLLRGADASQREKYWSQFQDEVKDSHRQVKALNVNLEKLGLTSVINELQKFDKQLTSAEARYEKGFQVYVSSGNSAPAADAEVKGVDRGVKETLTSFIEALDKEIAAIESRSQTSITIIISLIVVISILTLIGLQMAVNRSIVQRAASLNDQMQTLSTGDLRKRVDMVGEDEIAEIARELENFRQFVANLTAQVTEVSRELQTSSSAVNQGAQQIASNASEGEHQIHQAASALTEMAATIQEVARHANQTAEQTEHVATGTETALAQMVKSSGISQQLANEMASAAQIVAQLRDETKNIGQVLDVIKGIAEQTNLLALNAAIEAARAGEQGRGFAVVADEVRNLAQRTQESTSEIQQIIQNVQVGANNAANAMEHGNQRSRESAEQSESARQGLASIADSVTGIRDMNTQIATAAEEQNSVVTEITRNVNAIADGAKESANAARSGANTASNLSTLATRLNQMIANIKV